MGPVKALLAAEIGPRGRRQYCSRALTVLSMVWGVRGAARADAPTESPDYESIVIAPRPQSLQAHEDLAASASVLTRDRTPRSGESLPQLLAELPGVTVTRYGSFGSLSLLSLRGSAPNQVHVYIDGVPLHGATTGVVDLGQIPLTGVDRLEVYRGQSPLSFGPSALGGVLSITSELPTFSGVAGHVGGGSFGTRNAGAEGAWAGPRLRLTGRVNLMETQGNFPYAQDHGTILVPGSSTTAYRLNNALNQIDATMRAGVHLPGRRELRQSFSFFSRRQGLPGEGAVPTVESSLGQIRVLGSLTYEGKDDLGPAGRVRATIYGLRHEQRLHDPLREVSLSAKETHDITTTMGATVLGSHAFGLPFRLTGVVDARRENFSPNNALDSTNNTWQPGTRLQGAGGVEGDLFMQGLNLDLLPSVRIEGTHEQVIDANRFGRYTDLRHDKQHVLPALRFAAIQRPSETTTLRGNIGRYARLPTMSERYGDGGFIVGNVWLRPETSVSADVGARMSTGGPRFAVDLDAAVFGSRSRDLIHFMRLSDHTAGFANIASARTWGMELSAGLRFLKHGHWVTRGTFTDARDKSGFASSDGKRLPQQPRFRLYTRPELRRVAVGRTFTIGVHGDMDLTEGTFFDPANTVAMPTRVLLGAGAELAWEKTGLRLVVTGQNLTASPIPDLLYFPLPGRSVFVTLAWASSSENPELETARP